MCFVCVRIWRCWWTLNRSFPRQQNSTPPLNPIKPGMSNLKYKSSTNTTNSSSSTTNPSNQPIWCSLTTPSQIARKYASIAPIWCHISRPRQLKKKFASTLHQAQNLLTRQHSRENNLNGINYIFEYYTKNMFSISLNLTITLKSLKFRNFERFDFS